MLDSENFVDDIDYLAGYYGWNADDLADVMEQTVANPDEMGRYWIHLAAAHRAGYQQTRENNFMRLGQWLQLQGGGKGASVSEAAKAMARESQGEFDGRGQPKAGEEACVKAPTNT